MARVSSPFSRTLVTIVLLVFTVGVSAQVPADEEEKPVEPYTMTIDVGSRGVERTRTDTPVPVDVVPVSEVAAESAHVDVAQLLQFTAPSFNSNRQSGSDGSDHVDAATLRGLGPDQVLVLINGKRRHSSSLVYLFGTRGRGNVGTDLNTIPVSAIDRIEILRDGASAQYGSDAIAGVINIVLRNAPGLDVTLGGGGYTAGDGGFGQIGVNYGAQIGARGFLSVTGELVDRARTDRSAADEPRVIGDAAIENRTLFYNLDLPVGASGGFYGHGGYNDRDGAAGAWYREGAGSEDVPSRNSERMYPDGFVPTINTAIRDLSSTLGYRSLIGPWSFDVSTTYGSNRMEFLISDTLNASIATLNEGISPTRFDAGGFQFGQHTTNLDLTRHYPQWLKGVSVATGVEYRRETYEIFAGEEGSWRDFDGPGGGNAGSQGFPGFQPVDEVDASRNSTAAYVDVEMKSTDRLLVTAAVRGEDFSDFGSTVDGKLAAAYRATRALNLRASTSSGFRAPSLHQRYFSSTFTDFIAGEPADVKLAPNGSRLAKLVGIPELEEEQSMSYSAGFSWHPRGGTELTVDAYQIDIDDRIVLTGGFTADDADIGDIIRAENLVEARFFTNAIDTRTRGVDLTLAHARDAGRGRLASVAALNVNTTNVRRINAAPGLEGKEHLYFNERERLFVEGSAPKTKGMVSFDYDLGRWSSGVRVSYFGRVESGTWTQLDDPTAPSQRYDPRFTTDLHVSFRLTDGIVWTVGGTNIFDAMPTRQDPDETENGAHWENVQMGINGAAWFARLKYRLPR